MRHIEIQAFRSGLVVVTLEFASKRHKAFQIFFGRDRSLFVSFPYFKNRAGLLAAATIPGNGQTTSQVNLEIGGKVSSHLVKYSHHPDGRAHFSQHGKVRTEIKRQSVALDHQWGHIFTIMIQGLDGFDLADAVKDKGASPRRTALNFQLADTAAAQTIKFVGRWFDISALSFGGEEQPVVGPTLTSKDPTGRVQTGFLLASPHVNAHHVLFLTCETMQRVTPESELLLFYGGFAPRAVMNDRVRDAGFLAFMYRAANPEELRSRIGTIDL